MRLHAFGLGGAVDVFGEISESRVLAPSDMILAADSKPGNGGKVTQASQGWFDAIISPRNEFATRMFHELGFQVVASVGFSCADALHIAHIPDTAKERAIRELLATKENQIDAIVQCGTNMSLLDVTEKLETVIGIPVLGVNAVLFWYALRENGFDARLFGAGRLLREF